MKIIKFVMLSVGIFLCIASLYLFFGNMISVAKLFWFNIKNFTDVMSSFGFVSVFWHMFLLGTVLTPFNILGKAKMVLFNEYYSTVRRVVLGVALILAIPASALALNAGQKLIARAIPVEVRVYVLTGAPFKYQVLVARPITWMSARFQGVSLTAEEVEQYATETALENLATYFSDNEIEALAGSPQD